MLRECVRLAREERRVVVYVEPIAAYMTRDLHEPGDGLWTSIYSAPETRLQSGKVGVHGKGKQLAILTYGNGYYLSRQAAKTLNEKHQVDIRIIDIRWRAPLPEPSLACGVDPSDDGTSCDSFPTCQ